MTVAGQFKAPTVQPAEPDRGQPARIFEAQIAVAKTKKSGLTSALEGLNDGIALSTSLQKVHENELILQSKEIKLEQERQAQQDLLIQKQQVRQVLDTLNSMPDGPEKLQYMQDIQLSVTPEVYAQVAPAIKGQLRRIRYSDKALGQMAKDGGLVDQYFPEERTTSQKYAHEVNIAEIGADSRKSIATINQAGGIIKKKTGGTGSGSGGGSGAGTAAGAPAGVNSPELKEIQNATGKAVNTGVFDKLLTKYGARNGQDTREVRATLTEGRRLEAKRERGEDLVVNNVKYPNYESLVLSTMSTYLSKYSEEQVANMLTDPDVIMSDPSLKGGGEPLLDSEDVERIKHAHSMGRAVVVDRQADYLNNLTQGRPITEIAQSAAKGLAEGVMGAVPSAIQAISSPPERSGEGFGGVEPAGGVPSAGPTPPTPDAPMSTAQPGSYVERQQQIFRDRAEASTEEAEARLREGNYPNTMAGRLERYSDEAALARNRDKILAQNAPAADKRRARRTRKWINSFGDKINFPEAMSLTGTLPRVSDSKVRETAVRITDIVYGRGRGESPTHSEIVEGYIALIKHMLKYGE